MQKRRFPCLYLGLRCTAFRANTLVIIVATAVLHNFVLMHQESDFDEDIETKMSHLTLLLQQTQVGTPYASSLFHDTLLHSGALEHAKRPLAEHHE